MKDINPRPYQIDCVASIHNGFEQSNRVLVVMATGTGKTIVFALVARDWQIGRVMVIAHRTELISQAAKKIYAVTGEWPAIEQGDQFSNESEWSRSQFVVASKDSLHEKRLAKFEDIGLLIIDEAHRAARKNKSYSRVIDGLTAKNPNLKVLGVTATPKRHDDAAMGQVFDHVAYQYEIVPAIDDGWLVAPSAMLIQVSSLDLSSVKPQGEDLNETQLAKVMEDEQNVQGIADAAWRETHNRTCVLGFTAGVQQAKMMAEQMNRRQPGCADWLSGDKKETSDERRADTLKRFEAGDLKYLFNCGLFLEGYDNPHIDALIMARPTKSEGLFKQMIGRGTRPLDGTVDGHEAPESRRQAIAGSAKPDVLVLDFVDNSARHKLISTTDILGGKYCEEDIAAAKEVIRKATGEGRNMSVEQALKLAEQQRKEEEERQQRKREAERAAIVARAEYRKQQSDLFSTHRDGISKNQQAKARMPFGKHKGQLVCTLSNGYLRTILEKGNIKTEWLRKAITSELQIREREGFRQPVQRTKAPSIDDINNLLWEAAHGP